MVSRPNDFPDWDNNDTDTTQPPSSYVDDGAPSGEPVYRQYLNWMWNRIGRWIRWLDQSILRAGEIYADHQSPVGSFVANLTGATLVQPAAHFTTRVTYANGNRVAPTAAPSRTYTASRDTYWDIDEDGVLYPTEVTNGAAAPAITAGRTRVALAVSDGTSVTSVAVFPVDTHKRLSGRFTVPSTGLTYEIASNVGVIAEAGDIGPFDPSGSVSIGRQIWHSRTAGYATGTGLNQPAAGGHTFYKVLNARINAATGAVTRETSGADSYMYVFGARGYEVLFRDSALSDSWTNTIDASTGWTRLVGLSDAGVVEDQSFLGDVETAGEFTYASARSRTLWLFGREGQYGDDGTEFTTGASATPTATNLLLNHVGAGPATVVYPIHLPDGALITAANFIGSIGATGARVWLQRRSVSGGTTQSFNAGSPDYDVIASTASGSVNALTVNATSGIRTVDHSDYVYAAVVHYPSGSTGTIEAIEINYTVAQAD